MKTNTKKTMLSLLIATSCMCTAVPVLASNDAKDSIKDAHITSDTKWVVTGNIVTIHGAQYLANQFRNNNVFLDGHYYSLDENCQPKKNQIVTHNGEDYITDDQGKIINGTGVYEYKMVPHGEHTYVTREHGKIIKNKQVIIDGHKYVTDEHGRLIKNNWARTPGGYWNYCRANGQIAINMIIPIYSSGWSQTIDYAFDEHGRCINPNGYSHGREDLERLSE